MDALIYTTMSGAERALHAQQVHANNLANLETGGFQADLEQASSQLVSGYGYDARYLSQLQSNSVSTRAGVARETGRELDAAISGQGYFTVQSTGDAGQGGEAYTRAGHFDVDADGALTVNGRAVIGDGGPIVLPPYQRVEIGRDGTILVQAPGQMDLQPVDRLKLVKPDAAQISKNTAGLIVARDGADLPADDTVSVLSAHLEGSNVSAIEEMVAVMGISRDFEMQMKFFRAADSMADTGNTRLIRE